MVRRQELVARDGGLNECVAEGCHAGHEVRRIAVTAA